MKRALRITLISLASLVLLAVALLLIWLRDDPLDVEAEAWMAAVNAPRESSDGYIYLLGIDAVDEPMLVGHARQDEYRRWRGSHDALDPSFSPAPVKALKFSRLAQNCGGEWAYCLNDLASNAVNVDALLEDGKVVLQRYRELAQFEDLRSLAAFDASSPMPNYGVVIAGNRLLALDAYRMIRDGQTEQGKAMLEEDLSRWRHHLAAADTLIQKLVIANLVSADVGLLSALQQQGLISQPSALAVLKPSERSLQTAMRSEFALAANGFLAMPDDPQISQEQGRVAIYLLFKPNMSINAMLPRYRGIAIASQLEARGFADWLKEPADPLRQDWRNPIGNVLVGVAGPDMRKYLGRLHDLDARIRLFNRLNALDPGFSKADALAISAEGNPYGMGPAKVVEKPTLRLCYPGPMADEKFQRCLPMLSRD